MYNSNSSNNRGNFGSNNNNTSNEKPSKFRLQITAGCILVLGIVKLIFGNSQGFQSDLFTCLFILLVTTCGNGFIAGYLVISLLFEVIMTCIFFLLQLQNLLLNIVNPLPHNKLLILWVLNIISCILYTFAIYYCYRYFTVTESSNSSSSRGYSLLKDQPTTQNQSTTYYGTMSDRESNAGTSNNFKAFAGKGTTLDG